MATNSLITVKVGSNVLTNSKGLPDTDVIASICQQIKMLKAAGVQVILVSSGAVAAGRSIFTLPKKLDTVAQRQVLSSLGQVELISLYKEAFKTRGILCAQVLVTKEDFKSRNHYLNMKSCLTALLSHDIIPIINENDVVSVTELMFTDNDELAGLVSSMMNTSRLVILTNVEGVYNGDPDDSSAHVVEVYDGKNISLSDMPVKKSGFGRGGILTKCHTADKIARMGIPVHIANGRTQEVILKILNGEKVGTLFPARKMASNIKKYIAHAHHEAKARIVINQGAKLALLSEKAISLLPVGVLQIQGKFKKGEIVRILDEEGVELGLGMAQYGAKKAAEIIGMKHQKELIHYDHLYLH